MKYSTAIMGLLASAGIVAAAPGNGWGGHTTSSCWTSSTCKATYYTSVETLTKPVTVVSTKTIYTPVKETTQVPSTYISTVYTTKVISVTSTYLSTETSKVPSVYWSTSCTTVPVTTYTLSESVCTESKVYPSSTVIADVYTETTEVPKTIYTSAAEAVPVTSVSESTYTSVCTETTSTCATSTGWTSWWVQGTAKATNTWS